MEEPMKRRYLTVVISAVLFLLALGLTLYPVISNYVNQKYASTIQTAYQEILNQTDDSEIQKIKELAHSYNRALIPGAADAYSQTVWCSSAMSWAPCRLLTSCLCSLRAAPGG